MKTISLSALVLISLPFSVFAQDADSGSDSEKNDSYYLVAPEQSLGASSYAKSYQPPRKRSIVPVVAKITPTTKRVWPAVEPLTESPVATRRPVKKFNEPLVEFDEIEAPQVSASDYVFAKDSLIPNVKDDSASFIQQTSRFKEILKGNLNSKSGGDFNPNSTARFAAQEIAEVDMLQPEISPQDFPLPNEIVKPSPQNTVQVAEPPQPVIESVPPMPVADGDFNDEAPRIIESASIDDIRMSQRSNSWDQKPNMMRDVGDHFSPGGEPFAYRGIAGDANFFGVDRKSCCDEWAGMCNCSGGLKANPGHWGNPYLRSKDNCDTAKRVFGNHRAKKAARSQSCDCSSCNAR